MAGVGEGVVDAGVGVGVSEAPGLGDGLGPGFAPGFGFGLGSGAFKSGGKLEDPRSLKEGSLDRPPSKGEQPTIRISMNDKYMERFISVFPQTVQTAEITHALQNDVSF